MTTVEAFAPAKINLTLHVTGQRPDGYHLLDSLVAFADIGDTVTAARADALSLSIGGPQAAGLTGDDDNLVLRAARLLGPGRGAALGLTKRLPVASGIGGGSSDAGAALRALSRLWDLPLPPPADILALGADVPVCVTPRARRLAGIGERLSDVPRLPPCAVLLVNPGLSVATPEVFARLDTKANPPMPATIPAFADAAALASWLEAQRNDLAAPAIAGTPAIADVLAALRDTGPLFSAMSGSGATCFALFPPGEAAAARNQIAAAHPDWWCAAGHLL